MNTPIEVIAYDAFKRRFSGEEGSKPYRFIERLLKPRADRAAAKKPKVKGSSEAPSIAMLDKSFSDFIRDRDCPDGSGKCITCGSLKPQSEMDCGHYLGRQYYATRWNPMNCAAQCRFCNRFNEGMKSQFRDGLVRIYGEAAITRMEAMHKKGKKPRGFEAKAIIDGWRAK